MTRDDAEKLLGGYATGTLTAEERRLLFEAALADQTLFNALANEQALKELLDNPLARRRLLAALRPQAPGPSLLVRLREWLRPLVAVRAVAGGVVVAMLAVVTVTRLLDLAPPPSEVKEGSYEAGPAPGRMRSADKLTARQKPSAATKRSEVRDQPASSERAPREADTKQNKDAEPRPAAAPEAIMPPSTKAETPAAQSPAKTAPAAPPAEPPARADAGRSGKSGARDAFYGTTKKEQAPALERQFAESRSSSDIASQEQAAGAPVQRLGLRYGMVPREEGPALVVEVNHRGYLYAVARDASGTTTLVYPALAADPPSALAEPGARYFIPPLGALPATRLTLVLSRTPLANPTAPAAPRPAEKQDALLRQDTTEPPLEGVSGPTTYVVETVPAIASILSIEIVVPAR